jgi:HlyD family secretion protein
MLARFFLPIFSVIGMILGLVSVVLSHQSPPTPPVLFPPPASPYEHYIAAIGLIESSSENIAIGVTEETTVDEVYVVPGDFVPQGAPLFKLCTTVLEKELYEAQANLDITQREYERLLDLPNPVDIPLLEDKVDALQANYLDKLAQFELVENITREGAISRDEFNIRKFASLRAKFDLKYARDDLNKLLAGAWVRDLDIARAKINKAQAGVEVIQAKIARATTRAPYSGMVLATSVNPGQFAPRTVRESDALILFGVVDPLHVRIDVDEQDLWRIIPGAPARAFVRGNSNISVPLDFVRLEPFLVSKSSLSGGAAELVDTRVIQLIYELKPDGLPLYPGQVMDIFIESKPHSLETLKGGGL